MRSEGVTSATFPDGVRLEIGPAPQQHSNEALTTDETKAQAREQAEAQRRRMMFAAVGGPVRASK
jgi:hypothetical protein